MQATALKADATPRPQVAFTGYQKFVVALLAFLQFTIILDFMILSPLGAILMPALHITPVQFGTVVSVYAFSAGASGLLSAGFADSYDRKKLLLFFYTGFVLGTLMCGLAPTYHMLLAARMLTGLFGGVIGSVVFAIITDLFSFELRGRVMGRIQTAFAASQVLGIPAGLYFSNHWGWHAPFLMIVAFSSVAGIIMWMKMEPITKHLEIRKDHSALQHMANTLKKPRYLFAFAATALLSIGGFMLMPFGSAYTVNNLGIHIDQLPMIYLVTGICSIFMGPTIGWASDKFGKYKMFVFGTSLTMVMVYIYTHLGITPVGMVIVVNAIMFVGIFSRMIPSQALMSAIPSPESRGSFMSVSSSLQQVAGGIASVVAGWIVVEGEGGILEHFDTVGFVVIGTSALTLFMMYFIHRMVPERS
ncbi:MAG: MFS transporter [Oligoflexales bacterium]